MATVDSIATALVAALTAEIAEIDESSILSHVPAITTQSIALIVTPLGHGDEAFIYSYGWVHSVHNLRVQFWVRYVPGNEAASVPLARNICHRAIMALVEHDGTGYTLAAAGDAQAMTGQVSDVLHDAGGNLYFRATLNVPCMQKESV